MQSKIGILILISFYAFNSQSQSKEKKDAIAVEFFAGISIQKFALQQWVKPNSGSSIYYLGAEQNPEGVGLEIPIEIHFNDRNLILLANPIIRYDITTPAPFSGPGIKEVKSVFADFHFSVVRKLSISKNLKQPLKIGIGYSFISPFLAYDNPNPQLIPWKEIKLDFAGPHLLLSIPVGKYLYLKQQLMYIPKGQIMYYDFSEALMYHLSIGLRINNLKAKKES